MNGLKVCTAIRNKDFEDDVIKAVKEMGWTHSYVNMDDIVNENRKTNQVFVVEDNYASILNLIEFHNSSKLNFMPVVVLSSPDSKFKDWVKGVKYPEKYFHTSVNTFRYLSAPIITAMVNLAESYHNRIFGLFRECTDSNFKNNQLDMRSFLDGELKFITDLLYAERGSIMLLGDKNTLIIEAATKTSLVGLEVERKPDSVAWTVIDTMQPVFVENIASDPRFKKTAGYAKDYFLSLPIFLNKKIAGVLNLSDKMVSLIFDTNDYEKAQSLLAVMEPYLYIYKLTKYVQALRNKQ
ncbi:GAF domain-containing protein [bacterium]|nr:GAF domain-containing protein [bacterium]